MTHIIAIITAAVLTYVGITYFERKARLAYDIARDLSGK